MLRSCLSVLLLVAFLVTVRNPVPARSTPPQQATRATTSELGQGMGSVARYVEAFLDSTGAMVPEEVKQMPAARWVPYARAPLVTPQAAPSTLWYRFILLNDGPVEALFYWMPVLPECSCITHWTFRPTDGPPHAARMEFGQRLRQTSQDRHALLRVPPGVQDTVLVQVPPCGQPPKVQFLFMDALHFESDLRRRNLAQGFFAGIVLLLLIYNMQLYRSLGDPVFISFMVFLAGILLFYASIGDRIILILVPHVPLRQVEWLSLGLAGVLWGSFAVVRDLFQTRTTVPRLHAAMRALVVAALTAQGGYLIWRSVAGVPLSTLADVLMLIYIVCAAAVHVVLARRGSRTARALLWANLPYILAVAIQTLIYLNVPLGLDTFVVARSTQWAMTLQIVLFSFIIGDRIRSVRRAKETAEADARLAEAEMQHRTEHFEKEAARLEIQALRSQMNPHFIFNALNSIQSFVERNDPDRAGIFLSRFARLMRLVLENSRHAEVPLRSDLEALELYLNLEQARTNDRFSYHIHVDPAIDPDLVLVPPLVAQPFVENAIWHGMAGRTDRGHIALHVRLEGDDLRFVVEDDGQGRAAAGGRDRSPGVDEPALAKKTSLGTAITRARLDLVGRQKGRPAGFTYTDLPQGTRVVLTLPLVLDV